MVPIEMHEYMRIQNICVQRTITVVTGNSMSLVKKLAIFLLKYIFIFVFYLSDINLELFYCYHHTVGYHRLCV